MAAVTELCFLLFALINHIHAEEPIIIKEEWDSYTFMLPRVANTGCLISRYVGEEKLVLWNITDVWSDNSTVPEDLKEVLPVEGWGHFSYYLIHNLTHSDSGLYQAECWTEGKVIYESNISLIICSSMDNETIIKVRLGETVSLPCHGAADSLDVQWFIFDLRSAEEHWIRVLGDSTSSVMDNVTARYQVVKNTSALRVSSFETVTKAFFMCLVMNQQQCVSSHLVNYDQDAVFIYRSVGETAVLLCTDTHLTDEQPQRWTARKKQNQPEFPADQNYSLLFSSLTLNHTDWYYCQTAYNVHTFFLVVCPKFDPPAVELFSKGEDVIIRCRDVDKGMQHFWFFKSNQTEGRVVHVMTNLTMSRVSLATDGSLVISNVSLKDTGEYWCAVTDLGDQCVSTTKTVFKYRDPFGIHSTFYKVRCSVLSGLLVVLCAVVFAVMQRMRRGARLSAQTHS